MIGRIHDSDDPGHTRAQQRLDALANGHLSEAAALAAAFKLQPDPTLVDLDKDHSATMGCDNRIYLDLEDAANTFGKASFGALVQRLAARTN